MNKKWIKLSSIALMSLYLAACDTEDEEVVEDEPTEIVEEDESTEPGEVEGDSEETDSHEENDDADAEVTESIEIEGVAAHYHTGELVELTAVLSEDTDYDDWHWYIRASEEDDWEMVSGQNSSEYIGEAPEETVEIRAVLYDDSHQAYAQSEPVELEVDNH